jgi:hypothetical protein
MALQDDNRAAFAVGFDHLRLKQMIVLHMQVGTSRTFLLIEIDRLVDKWGVGKWGRDSPEAYHTRFEQHRGLSALPG